MKLIYFCFSMFILLFGCGNKPENHDDPIPAHDSLKIVSTQLGETRTINVWTPPEYSVPTDSFPVLYMPDGGIKEDFPHIANTLAELIKAKKIPPIMLVGIENTERRRDLTGPTEIAEDKKIAPIVGGSEKFRAFIKDALFPEIEKRYRTSNKKGIIGESLAGLFAMETFLLKPDMFNFYIAFDPSLWWNNQYLIKTSKENLAKFPPEKIRLWFAGSKDVSDITELLAKDIESVNLKTLTWKYTDEPKEKHSTIFRATKEKALIWTLNAK